MDKIKHFAQILTEDVYFGLQVLNPELLMSGEVVMATGWNGNS